MTEDQLSELWAFARGDRVALDFEKWFLSQNDLEGTLGEDLHWSLASANYGNRDEVWKLRKALAAKLEPTKQCECMSVRDLGVVPMGGDGLDERTFATLERIKEYGGKLWWLYISKCNVCREHWMIAQDERIYDNYYLKRLQPSEADDILNGGGWPDDFITYERVLKLGRTLSQPWTFSDPRSPSLVWTADDLRNERPDITIEEIAYLLAISPAEAALL